jgi:hypothetical protein
MNDWMKLLNRHYSRSRKRYPGQKLLILFDIDGTILDMRYVILYVLREIDKKNGTNHFAHLDVSHIGIHEEDIDKFLDDLSIPAFDKEKILSSYWADLWSSTAVLEAHKPFRGVMEVIRWFQVQPDTYVGLNTGRPESLRFNTLISLNKLGKGYMVRFRDELLYMKPENWTTKIPEAKVHGVEYFRHIGYRPVAMIDNEPENLEALTRSEIGRGMLLLHADTISKSKLTLTSRKIIRGDSYNVDPFINGLGMRRSA